MDENIDSRYHRKWGKETPYATEIFDGYDVDCSPADYLINLGLERGHSMTKDCRFRKSRINNDSSTCSRSFRKQSSNSENNCCMQSDKHPSNEKFVEFSRSDQMRKSFKMTKNGERAKAMRNATNKQCENDQSNKPKSYDTEESVDDDYVSMTSSDDLNSLNTIEDYELNEVCKAIRSLLQNKSTEAVPEASNSIKDAVLRKLERKDKNVKGSKEDLGCFESLEYHHKWDYNARLLFNAHKSDDDLIRSLIKSAIEKLGASFEKEKLAILKNNEEQIINLVADMYAMNNRSSSHIKELCNETADELMHNLKSVLESTRFELNSSMETDDMHEFKGCIKDETLKQFDNESLHDVVSDYLEQTHEISQGMEEDLSDITIRCLGTQQMLDMQEAILNEMKDKVWNLKSSL